MYESPIMLLKTDPFIQCLKNETDTMIIQGVARVGVHVDKDELIKAIEYDRGQYEKGFHDGRMYVPPCPSNADRIRAMSDDELTQWLDNLTEVMMPWCDHPCPDGEQSICKNCISEWLRQEANE